jgi:large subunit ribosomal protein L18
MPNQKIRRNRSKKKLINNTHPVLVISKSNANISAQIMDPNTGKTLFGSSSNTVTKGTKSEKAEIVGQSIAKTAQSKKISKIVVDRNGYVYHGRVKTLVESVRKHGITI